MKNTVLMIIDLMLNNILNLVKLIDLLNNFKICEVILEGNI